MEQTDFSLPNQLQESFTIIREIKFNIQRGKGWRSSGFFDIDIEFIDNLMPIVIEKFIHGTIDRLEKHRCLTIYYF